MTRFGWIFAGSVLLIGAAFLSMTSFGGAPSRHRWIGGAVHRWLPPRRPAPPTGLLAVPVSGYPRERIENNWGDPRDGGTRVHHGIDIMAARGTLIVSAAAGTVEKLFQSVKGGTTLYVRSPDRRWTYYYAHLSGYAPGVREGLPVRTGDPLGYVGDTGDAGAGNYHLHFGVERLLPGQRWWQGEEVNPYPHLVGPAGRR